MFAFRSLTTKVSFSFKWFPIGLIVLLVFFSNSTARAQEQQIAADATNGQAAVTINQEAGKIDQLKQLFPEEQGLVKELAK
ncbi:MAG: hypothetical protein P8J33_05715, partial [Pirellulaceae bacterium]|nr:hypothetical protein [Pirellulaceae bacterium]